MPKQLMSRESFLVWLQLGPDPDEVIELMDYTDFWNEMLTKGGGTYAKDIRKMGTKYLADMANGNSDKRNR